MTNLGHWFGHPYTALNVLIGFVWVILLTKDCTKIKTQNILTFAAILGYIVDCGVTMTADDASALLMLKVLLKMICLSDVAKLTLFCEELFEKIPLVRHVLNELRYCGVW